jgi:hypothetical protein
MAVRGQGLPGTSTTAPSRLLDLARAQTRRGPRSSCRWTRDDPWATSRSNCELGSQDLRRYDFSSEILPPRSDVLRERAADEGCVIARLDSWGQVFTSFRNCAGAALDSPSRKHECGTSRVNCSATITGESCVMSVWSELYGRLMRLSREWAVHQHPGVNRQLFNAAVLSVRSDREVVREFETFGVGLPSTWDEARDVQRLMQFRPGGRHADDPCEDVYQAALTMMPSGTWTPSPEHDQRGARRPVARPDARADPALLRRARNTDVAPRSHLGPGSRPVLRVLGWRDRRHRDRHNAGAT